MAQTKAEHCTSGWIVMSSALLLYTVCLLRNLLVPELGTKQLINVELLMTLQVYTHLHTTSIGLELNRLNIPHRLFFN